MERKYLEQSHLRYRYIDGPIAMTSLDVMLARDVSTITLPASREITPFEKFIYEINCIRHLVVLRRCLF